MTAPVPLAVTKAKLPRSILIKGIKDLYFDLTTASQSAIISELHAGVRIGAIEKISIDQKIDLHDWREFDPDQGGQVVEWAPGKEEISITLSGVILYEGDILSSFGYDVDTLLAMRKPFAIEIIERRPNPSDTNSVQARSKYFVGCRFGSRPETIDIGTGDLIKQDVEVKAARLIKTDWA
jgi:hypothetical protein